jgi:hypothetical protein
MIDENINKKFDDVLKTTNSILGTNLKDTDKIADLVLINVDIYEGGKGIKLTYMTYNKKTDDLNDRVTASIFIYNNNIDNIPSCNNNVDNINNEILKNEFNSNHEEILQMLEIRKVDILDIGKPRVVKSSIPMLFENIIYLDNQDGHLTQLYLTSINNNFLKMRISANLNINSSKESEPKKIQEKLSEKNNIISDFINSLIQLI